MGASGSKPDVVVDEGSTSFFAHRDVPVQFSEDLINQLSSSPSSPSPARQETLDSHVQARISAELSRLRAQEASVREEIERALEKENFVKETESGVSHSASLLADLEDLERRTVGLKAEIEKNRDQKAWSDVQAQEEALQTCLNSNKSAPLNCRAQADLFIQAVAGVEKSFMTSIH